MTTFTENHEVNKRQSHRNSALRWHFGGKSDQLSNEDHKAVLKGTPEDVKEIRKLDILIGKMTSSFNNVARVPDDVVDEINRHVRDLSPCFRRVRALKGEVVKGDDAITAMFKEFFEAKVEKDRYEPLYRLQYTNVYTSRYGNEIRQEIASIRLG